MKLTNFILSAAAILAFSACSSDEPDNLNDIDDFIWGGCGFYKSHLITPIGNVDGEEIADFCYVLHVPKEGGSYSFTLSPEAADVEESAIRKISTPIETYDFIPIGIAEILYTTPDEMWCLPTQFSVTDERFINSYGNKDKESRIDTDWIKFESHVGKNSFTVTVPENTQEHRLQFNVWFEDSYFNGCDNYLSYALILIQE